MSPAGETQADTPAAGRPEQGGWLSGARLATLGLLGVALVGLWQVLRLERWSFDGPGPGLYPLMVVTAFIVLALVVLIWPGKAGATEDGDTESIDPLTRQRTKRGFAIYGLSLLVLAAGSALLGFTLTAVSVSILIVRFAEGRSWLAALAYGLGSALVGLVGFGWLLRVDLPAGPIERLFYSLVR